jgi:chromosome partitioning protein
MPTATTTYIENAFDFEKIIQMSFKNMGFDVIPNKKDNEPGYDFIVKKDKHLLAVQVKNHKRPLSINVVHKFREFMDSSKIKRGILISAKGFSNNALVSIEAEKLKNFYLGHFDESQRKILWDYPQKGMIVEPSVAKSHYISVFTAKGGVGKTTIAAHLAGAFALSGYKTNIIDGDPELNLHRVTGGAAVAPNVRTGEDSIINVSKESDWQESDNKGSAVTILDCSPALERNNVALLKKTESFIIPTSISPLDIGNNAEVLIRSVEQIRQYNATAVIFMLLNKYASFSSSEIQRFKNVQRLLEDIGDKKVFLINPNVVNIRESRLLKTWGAKPDLSFRTVGGRCYPRDDFLTLAEFLLENVTIK